MHPTQNTVRKVLTPRPPRRRDIVETDEFAAFTRRIVAAYGRRVAGCDIEALTDLAGLAQVVDTALREAVAGLRACDYSWTDIAARLGITKQTAWERFGGDRS
jgi:hypothetical protein